MHWGQFIDFVASKEFKCSNKACTQVIEPKEKYLGLIGSIGGRRFTVRTHVDCFLAYIDTTALTRRESIIARRRERGNHGAGRPKLLVSPEALDRRKKLQVQIHIQKKRLFDVLFLRDPKKTLTAKNNLARHLRELLDNEELGGYPHTKLTPLLVSLLRTDFDPYIGSEDLDQAMIPEDREKLPKYQRYLTSTLVELLEREQKSLDEGAVPLRDVEKMLDSIRDKFRITLQQNLPIDSAKCLKEIIAILSAFPNNTNFRFWFGEDVGKAMQKTQLDLSVRSIAECEGKPWELIPLFNNLILDWAYGADI